jgi:NADPH-dependent 2,4-dienoyl-CoA reductase/sulfur reductase-like enzyme
MKVIVVGCTHTGTAAVANIKKQHNDVDINVYEINDNISFLSCGIAMCVDNTIENIDNFFYSSPDQLRELGANMYMKHKVVDIDFDKKEATVLNLATNEEFKDSYDKLIVTTGSWPIEPNIKGSDLDNILLCKNYGHANKIIEKRTDTKKVAVVGCGYIGMELAEAYNHLGKEVVIIDLIPNLLGKYVDSEFSQMLSDEVTSKGIKLALGQTVVEFQGVDGKVSKVITDQDEFEVDTVILSIGFRPNTKFLEGKLDMLPNGAIVVNEYMQTSDESVFAGGDSVCLDYLPNRGKSYLPLATNAVRTGAIIASNIKELKAKHPGTNATSSVKIFGYHVSTTGLTEAMATSQGMEVSSVMASDNHLFEFVEGSQEQHMKIVFETESRRVVGAQFISRANLPQTINVLSLGIHKDVTIDELAFADFYFMPHFNKVWNIINTAAQQAI